MSKTRQFFYNRVVVGILSILGALWSTASHAQGYPPNPLALPIPADSLPPYVRQRPADDPVIQRIWDEAMTRSQAVRYLQILSDSLGPRLTGSPGMDRAQAWLLGVYQSLGVPARREQYGTWEKWERGITHLDLIAPRFRTLDAAMMPWSPSTKGRVVEGAVVTLPDVTTHDAFTQWLPNARGKVVLLSAPRRSCRSKQQWEEYGTPESRRRITAQQDSLDASWRARVQSAGGSLAEQLRRAGALAVLVSNWSGYPGVRKIYDMPGRPLPVISVGCEDYTLLAGLAEHHQGPRVRLQSDARSFGEQPVFNVIGEIKGSEKPDEYVILGAHFDSWDGASGTTDNGTGTVTMLEAMRILRKVYPAPKRTIIVGHWSGEEQGLIGSKAFTEDHPDIMRGLQVAYNQDDGTGRLISIGAASIPEVEPVFRRYLSEMPREITRWIRIEPPSPSATNGSDNSSFDCYGVPVSSVASLPWDYDLSTWHTNMDTYDKAVEEDLENNAAVMAMLAYLASEDPNRLASPHRDLSPAAYAKCKTTRRHLPHP